MDIEKGMKVKLTVDLTQYAKGLVAGTEGITAGQQGMWSRGSDRFITVRFPGITTLDVLWDSLEIIDEEVLKEIDHQKKEAKIRLPKSFCYFKHSWLNLKEMILFLCLHFAKLERRKRL